MRFANQSAYNNYMATTPNPHVTMGGGKGGAKPAGMAGPKPAGMARPGQTPFANASSGLNAAQNVTAAGTTYQPGLLASTNMQPYMNRFDTQVMNRAMRDMNRSRNMAMNDIGAAATAAGAFGGSRHGVAEAETNRGYFDRAANMAAGLRRDSFNNAQNAAMFDIGTDMQANAAQQAAAAQLAGIAGQQFNTGQAINQSMLQAGNQQQALQQDLINAIRAQWAGHTGAPGQSLQYPLAAIGASPTPTTTTTTQQPGLFNILSLLF